MSITRKSLQNNERVNHPARIFGDHFPLRVEPFVFDLATDLSRDYLGGYWEMYALSNGGFYIAPESETVFQVSCVNGYEGTLTADALGITVCLYAFSNLSFSDIPDFAETCAEQYHLLRDYMLAHPEVQGILGAID